MEGYYVVGNFSPHAHFVPSEQYGTVVRDNVVRTCVDVLMMRKDGAVLLGKRNIEPWPHWFTFGGAMKPGERPQETASRIVSQDVGLAISPERFVRIGEADLIFARRREPPQENGAHDHDLFHFLVLNGDEASRVVPKRDEYDQIKWWKAGEITLRAGFHSATVDIVKEAIGLRRKGVLGIITRTVSWIIAIFNGHARA